jgi:hypothetical protein
MNQRGVGIDAFALQELAIGSYAWTVPSGLRPCAPPIA